MVTASCATTSAEPDETPKTGRGLFVPRLAMKTEMAHMMRLRERAPDVALKEVQHGAGLVKLARDGELARLQELHSPPFFWFTVHMFHAAAVHGRIQVVDFMAKEGAPVLQPPLCEALTLVAQNADDPVPITRHLVNVVGLQVSYQRPSDFFTALHVACSRAHMDLVACLIDLGADVNAVAKQDVMPLHCAESQPLRDILLARGARTTWRRQPLPDDDPGDDKDAWVLATDSTDKSSS